MAEQSAWPSHQRVEASDDLLLADREQLCARYFSAEAADYDEYDESVEKRRLYCAAVDDYASRIIRQLDRCDTLLSFGCGTGRRELAIADHLPSKPLLVGVEISPKMAEIAASRGIKTFPDLTAAEYSLANPVNTILCLSSFVHVPTETKRANVLRGFRRLIAPDGVLIIDVFNMHDRYEWGPEILSANAASSEGRKSQSGDVYYRRVDGSAVSYMHYFTIAEICQLLEEAGFIVTDLKGVGYARQSGQIGVPLDEGCALIRCQVSQTA